MATIKLDSEQTTKLKNYIANLQPGYGGKFLYHCLPFRKKVVLENLNSVFSGILSEKEIKKLALAFYQHVFLSLKENVLLRFSSMQKMQQHVTIKGVEHLLEIDRQKKSGAIIITGHFGNWEFAPILGINQFQEYRGRIYFVRKLIGNKWLEKILFRRFYQAGLNVIPKKNSLMQVCDALENRHAVVFVHDQHASLKAKDGIQAEFLGKPAATFRSPAMLARHMNVPVLPARSYRDASGQHVLEFFPPLQWIADENSEQELKLNTQHYNDWLERFVLAHPDQWLWMHKRWK